MDNPKTLLQSQKVVPKEAAVTSICEDITPLPRRSTRVKKLRERSKCFTSSASLFTCHRSKNQDGEVRRFIVSVSGETISSESENTEIEKTPESFIDNEAIETGSYVSGESQDEEERRYIAENEIPVRGETISSVSDVVTSNSDYERETHS